MTGTAHDHVVVGGGIVGLATAHHLLQSRPGADVVLLDKEPDVGRHQTGHNSGVIHSGIYYEPGRSRPGCAGGGPRTEEYAAQHGVPVRVVGKLLVATDERELAGMHALRARADVNQVAPEVIDAAELRRREPAVTGLGALWLPGTGITDYGALARALAADVREAGGEVRTGCEVRAIDEAGDEVRLPRPRGSSGPATWSSAPVSRPTGSPGWPGWTWTSPSCRSAGVLRRRARAGRPGAPLVYPIPDPALPFLGVHLTPTVDGGLTVGPNAVLGLAREGYPKFSFSWRDAAAIARFRGIYPLARRNVRTGARELRTRCGGPATCASARSTCPG